MNNIRVSICGRMRIQIFVIRIIFEYRIIRSPLMVTNNWPIQQSAKTMRSEIMTPVEGGTEEAILSIKREPSGWPRVSSTTTTQRLFSDCPSNKKLIGLILCETFLLKVLLPCERGVTEGSPAVQRTSSTVRSETI